MRDAIWFRAVCRQNGIDVTDEQIAKLERFSELLLNWNKKINLISRRDEENFWTSHLLHSVSILFRLRFPQQASVIDLGTGGGLPGIPLKILLPEISITLLDSTQKKIQAVQDILDSLSIKNASAIWGRAEDLGKRTDHRGLYDIVVARAVAPLRDLVHWSQPLLKATGGPKNERKSESTGLIDLVLPTLIALKGGSLEAEVRSASRAGSVASIQTIDLTLAGSVQLEAGDKKIVLVTYR